MGALLGGKCPDKTMHLIAYSYPITERGSPSMNTHDDDLRLRLGRIRNRGARYKGFFAEVRSAAWNEGYIGARLREPRGPARRTLVAAAAAPCVRGSNRSRVSPIRKSAAL